MPSETRISDSATLEDRPPRAFVAGVCSWNHATIRALFASPDGEPVFCDDCGTAARQARASRGRVVSWASRTTARDEEACAAAGAGLVRVEDGFLRSIGLGAGFVPAASLAVDHRGIYYDATRPSDIEHALETLELTDAERRMGGEIRASIAGSGLTKYNLRQRPLDVPLPEGRTIVLVPGQVSDDASVRHSVAAAIDATSDESINLQLLRLVRSRDPDAFIIYRPHPDVTADLRAGRVSRHEAGRYADAIVSGADVVSLIGVADRIETISSLAGFEAILRGKPVAVHGLPFYAGWGLTVDAVASPRRTRRRTIDELAYIAFAKYTRHVDPGTRRRCDALELIKALLRLRESRLHRMRVASLQRIAWAFEHARK